MLKGGLAWMINGCKMPKGRPRKADGEDDDALRAMIIEKLRQYPGMARSNRFLINFAQRLEQKMGVKIWEGFGIGCRDKPLFGAGNLEFSVSRGLRKINRKLAEKSD